MASSTIDPNEFESAKGARRALQEACAAYPEVQQAVDYPAMYRRRALPVANGNASVIPVSNGRALLTIEVRKGKQKYGLFGGKAEPGETLAQTAAREAFEESGNALSVASRNAISQLEPAAFKECRCRFHARRRRARGNRGCRGAGPLHRGEGQPGRLDHQARGHRVGRHRKAAQLPVAHGQRA